MRILSQYSHNGTVGCGQKYPIEFACRLCVSICLCFLLKRHCNWHELRENHVQINCLCLFWCEWTPSITMAFYPHIPFIAPWIFIYFLFFSAFHRKNNYSKTTCVSSTNWNRTVKLVSPVKLQWMERIGLVIRRIFETCPPIFIKTMRYAHI